MATPGIEVRPLRQMTGGSSFNEVFLSDVRIPAENVVGTVNEGWRVTMTTLGHERSMSGGGSPFPQLVRLVRNQGALGDPVLRDLLVQCYVRGRLLEFLGYRAQTRLSRGEEPGPESSVMKLAFSQLNTLMARVAIDAQGPTGMLVGEATPDHGTWQQQFLSTPSFRIAAGTDEVQRNVLGERVLGLPAEPRVDKDAPFRSR